MVLNNNNNIYFNTYYVGELGFFFFKLVIRVLLVFLLFLKTCLRESYFAKIIRQHILIVGNHELSP